MHQYILGATQLERSLTEKDLGALAGTKLNNSQQGVPVTEVANSVVVFIRQSIVSRSWEVILPLYSA